jgi:galactitol-specific phosphotransferase system IIC component
MGEREARALADGLDQALREEVATRTDLRAVKTELAADIAAVKTELAADIAAVKTELKGDIAATKHDMLRWMVGMAFGQVALTVALIRFLPH